MGGQKLPVCFLSFKAPQHQESVWNEQTQPQTPPRWRSKNVNFTPSANSSVARKGSEKVVGKDGDLSTA